MVVENKIREGAVQARQLFDYYQSARKQSDVGPTQVLAVYVAHGHVRQDEVGLVAHAIDREAHPLDRTVHLVWEDGATRMLGRAEGKAGS